MEQYQNPVVIEPAKPKKPLGVQIAALILGLVGAGFSFLLYVGAILRVVFSVVFYETGDQSFLMFAGIATVVLRALVCVICIVGIVLGIIGLVKSIRRATRTVKGIILSAIGLDFAVVGLVFTILSTIFSVVLARLLPQLINALS